MQTEVLEVTVVLPSVMGAVEIPIVYRSSSGAFKLKA